MANIILSENDKRRFARKIAHSAEIDCAEWGAGRFSTGYGQFWLRGANVGAHRIAWVIANGQIPDGMCVLHHCDNRRCVNVGHLFLGTVKDNISDMDKKRRRGRRAPRTHCPHGHEYSGENLFFCRGEKRCRACARGRYWATKSGGNK